jgi:hypothetical protein
VVKGTALYTTTFTPSTTPLTPVTNTSLLTCQSPSLIDNSANNFTITKAGDVSVQRFSPFNPVTQTPQTYSGYFDGSSNYLTFPDSASFDYLTGDFSCDMWVYPTSVTGDKCLLQLGNYGAGQTGILFFLSGTGRIFIGYNNAFIGESTGSVVINTWSYLSWIRTSGVLKMYVNGVEKVSSSFTSSIAPATYFGIGVNLNPVANYFPGYISSVRLSNIARSFTVPTVPTTSDANTSLLTCQSPTFIDNSTNAFAITSVGNTTPRAFNPFGFTSATTNGYTVSTIGGSGYFDGTGDYLNLNGQSAFAFGSSANFTIQFWFYATAISADVVFYDSRPTTTQGLYPTIYLNGTTKVISYVTNSTEVITGTTTIVVNQWYYVTLSRNSGSTRLFVNGVQQSATYSDTINYANPANRPTIMQSGYASNGYLTGYVTDFQVLTGTAAYTSNFVPPSAPVVAIQNSSLLLNMTSAGIYDAAMMNNMETVGDAKLSTAISKFGGSSMFFDGTGDYLSIPASQNMTFGTGNFTIEFWFYAPAQGTTRTAFIGTDVSYAANFWTIQLNNTNPAYSSRVQLWCYNMNPAVVVGSTTLTTSTWYHVAVVRNGTAITIYLNGTSDGTGTSSASLDGGVSQAISIAKNLTDYYTGYIDDLRITKGYARYTTNFTPATSAFPIF